MLTQVLLATFFLFHAGPAPAASPLDGNWSGQVSAGSTSYYMGVTVIAGGSALVHYSAPYNCDGTWHEVSHAGNVYTYRESIFYQFILGQKCPDGDTIVMTLTPSGSSVQYASSGGSSPNAQGSLDNVGQMTDIATAPP